MEPKELLRWKRDELLNLHVREFGKVTEYDSIVVCPTRNTHDSGYRLMAIIGCLNMHPIEVAAYCDDLEFTTNGLYTKYGNEFQCDMILSNCIHFHSRYVRFRVGTSLSSTGVDLVPREESLNFLKKQ